MDNEHNPSKQKLRKKLAHYINYCSSIKTNTDLLLSKQDIQRGKYENHSLIESALSQLIKSVRADEYFDRNGRLAKVIDYPRNIEEFKASLLQFGCKEVEPCNSKEEEIHINYLYNIFVLTMTQTIDLILFSERKNSLRGWLEDKNLKKEFDSFQGEFHEKDRNVQKNLDRLIDNVRYFNSYKGVFEIPPFVLSICNIKKVKKEGLFGRTDTETHYVPKTTGLYKEMLGWIESAEEILKQKRRYSPEKDKIKEEEAAERKRKEILLREEEKKKKEKENKKRMEEKKKEEEKKKKEIKQREFEYDKQLKRANYILLLFFTVLTVFVSYLYQNDGRMEKETFENIQNMAVFISIPLIYFIYYYTYRYNYTHVDKEDKTTEIKNIIKGSYTKKEKLKIFVIALVLATTITFDYIAIFYLIVALITSLGIYRAHKANQKINADRVLFEENKSIKSRIEKYIKTVCNHNIDVPFYGFTKVSDKVIDEIYHFFKDKKTEIEISMRTVKDSDVPYDEMDAENLYYAVEKSKEYDKLEKDGFSELQKIKAYGSVLERI